MKRQTTPCIVGLESGNAADLLQRKSFGAEGEYDEKWVQVLIDRHPEVLPISAIEPGFWPVVSCCMELGLSSGALDNLLVTPLGNLILIECKLWRNVDARRKVIAQVIDYAKGLQRLGYKALEETIGKARKEADFKLYEFVSQSKPGTELDEPEFIDAVSRNLRRGRCLLIIAGDGITENIEEMAEYLQQHAGLHFALALVQLAVYDIPGNKQQVLVVPSIPMRTENIIRGIVQVEDARVTVTQPQVTSLPGPAKSTTLTEEEFYSRLDQNRSGTSDRLRKFINDCEDLQIRSFVRKNLTIMMSIDGNEVRPFVISPDGQVDTSYMSWFKKQELLKNFTYRLALAIPGTEVRQSPTTYMVRLPERFFNVWELLDHIPDVRAALEILHSELISKQKVCSEE